jgi:PPK2 family polyphosphate:nucleotide phosphotransferase
MRTRKFLVAPGRRFRVSDHDPEDTAGLRDKQDGARRLERNLERLRDLQERLWADQRWALLIVLQGMDAAGKDSIIEHVMSGVNPQGCEVHGFKAPSTEELGHDFLWRAAIRLPERGRIGIFNRSYYEEVLVVRVHAELLAAQRLPPKLVGKRLWAERFEDINALEQHLARNGTVIRKFFLNISRGEQRRRFLERLDQREKRWKFSLHDVEERERWNDYMRAYEAALETTSTKDAPWYVVPADHKWVARLVVSEVIVETLDALGLEYPAVDGGKRKELAAARARLARG